MTSPIGSGGTSGGGPAITVPGIGSGLDTTAIVNALLQSYDLPITNLQNEQSSLNSLASIWQGISTDLTALQTAASTLSLPSGWQATTVTSSATAVATGTTSGASTTGSVTFTVDQLAQGESLVSSGTVAATSDVVTQASSLLVSSGTEALGFSSLATPSGSTLALGAHTIDVTTASAPASTTGTAALASSTTITAGSNDGLNVTVDGTAYSLTIAPGTYTPTQLAQAITTAATTAGAPLSASVDSQGRLVLSTTDQGSAANLQVTGGSALSSLNLSTMSTAATGTDAVVTVDGTSNTVTHVTAGGSLTLSAGSGATITAVVGSSAQLSVGSVTAQQVSNGNGSLADVVAAINGAGAGLTASAVSNGSGGYLLDIQGSSTGADANVGIDPGAFSSSSLGTLTVAQAAQDAKVSLGGAGGPVIASATNEVSGLLPGLTATLVSVSSTPVTLTVAPDASTAAANVKSLVDAANKVLSDISTQSQYDSSTKTGGPLLGNGMAESITQQVLAIFSSVAGTSGLGNTAAAGITESKGTLTFDQATFESAYQADPSKIESLFTQGGTFAPSSSTYTGQVSLIYAGDGTKPGSYAVSISQSATQATDTGTVAYASSSATLASADTLTVSVGSTKTTYQASAGESLSQVASGLDSAFAGAGLSLSAQVVTKSGSSYLEITSSGYGSQQSFTATESGTALGVAGTFTGTDVAGTINGVAATGSGQFLSAPTTDPTLAGLSLQVTATGITSATTIGTYTYTPGVAQQLSSLATSATSVSGLVTSEISSLHSQASGLDPQIASYQQIANEEKAMLEASFSQLDATLSGLKQQSSYLAAQLGGSSSSSSGSIP